MSFGFSYLNKHKNILVCILTSLKNKHWWQWSFFSKGP